ncbi:hypothetical protein ABZS81_12345 [Streptomyces sp. NPDC005318]
MSEPLQPYPLALAAGAETNAKPTIEASTASIARIRFFITDIEHPSF